MNIVWIIVSVVFSIVCLNLGIETGSIIWHASALLWAANAGARAIMAIEDI